MKVSSELKKALNLVQPSNLHNYDVEAEIAQADEEIIRLRDKLDDFEEDFEVEEALNGYLTEVSYGVSVPVLDLLEETKTLVAQYDSLRREFMRKAIIQERNSEEPFGDYTSSADALNDCIKRIWIAAHQDPSRYKPIVEVS